MAVYSFSKLSTFEKCPCKYKLIYLDKITRPDEESIEAYMGDKVHKTLQKCYENVRHGKITTLDELIDIYKRYWDENWHPSVFIVRKEYTPENYRDMGMKMLENYYKRYAPFDADITLGTELKVTFPLDVENKYVMTGVIDRICKTHDGIIEVHDYKTSSSLPSQKEIDEDMQLGLYQIAVQNKWPSTHNIRLIWHYLAADTDLISHRESEELDTLAKDTIKLIDKIESAGDFPPQASALCEWCEYTAYCPLQKHPAMVDRLPINEYLNEPGVVLVNKYAELRDRSAEIKAEMEQVKEALVDYARKENALVIKGNDYKARVRIEHKMKFPGKNDEGRSDLDDMIVVNGKWMEVSQLDTIALLNTVNENRWPEELNKKIMEYARSEESATVTLSKLNAADN